MKTLYILVDKQEFVMSKVKQSSERISLFDMQQTGAFEYTHQCKCFM